MWILNLLPNWIFYAIFFAGLFGLIVTYFMQFIPFVGSYRIPIQIVSILAIVIGTYMSGAISNEESWQAKVKELELKVDAAKVESYKENVKIVDRVVKKTEYITQRGQDIIQYVDREIVKYDDKFKSGGQCELPKEFIKAMNKAAEAPK
jgi:hypothetical protein